MYTYESIVNYSSVDRYGKLPLYEILNLLQDCTNLQSESIGMGIQHMANAHKGWILVSYKIKIKEEICFGQQICTRTAASGFSSIYGNRKFQIDTKDGKNLVEADSLWVLMDLETRRPIRVTEDEKQGYVIEEGINDLKAERKMKFSDTRKKMGEFQVRKTFIDNNGHMNNADYLRVAAEFIPENFSCHMLDIVYNKEAMEGDTMIAYMHEENDVLEITFEDTAENSLAKIKISK